MKRSILKWAALLLTSALLAMSAGCAKPAGHFSNGGGGSYGYE